MIEKDLLEIEAQTHDVFISDLRQRPLLQRIIADILTLDEEAFPLSQWNSAVSYLLDVPDSFSSVADVKSCLRRFLSARENDGQRDGPL